MNYVHFFFNPWTLAFTVHIKPLWNFRGPFLVTHLDVNCSAINLLVNLRYVRYFEKNTAVSMEFESKGVKIDGLL